MAAAIRAVQPHMPVDMLEKWPDRIGINLINSFLAARLNCYEMAVQEPFHVVRDRGLLNRKTLADFGDAPAGAILQVLQYTHALPVA